MNKVTAIGIKETDKPYRIVNTSAYRMQLDLLPPGKYQNTTEKYKKKKSNPQLGYLFAVIYPIVLKGLNDAGWEFTSVEQVDVKCKSMFAGVDVINRHTGEIETIPELKRDMTTTEMMNYVESIRQWSSEYLNTYIPNPGENFNIEFE